MGLGPERSSAGKPSGGRRRRRIWKAWDVGLTG